MIQFLQIHPDNPQQRLIDKAVGIIRAGGVIAYPTDSGYALGYHLGDKVAMERVRAIRQLGDHHNFTLVCRDLSELAVYAKVDNSAYRLIKNHTPGPYTFILQATKEVPQRLRNPKRKTIGLRVPDNRIAMALLETLGEPLMSSTLILPGDDMPLTDPYDIRDSLEHSLDLVIDGGYCGFEPTTVVDLTGGVALVTRQGLGSSEGLES